MTDKIIPIPGSEGWIDAYERGKLLDERFPEQEGDAFSYAMQYNGDPFADGEMVASLVCEQLGDNDGPDWVWLVETSHGRTIRFTGGCDYTGWDCQSYLSWEIA